MTNNRPVINKGISVLIVDDDFVSIEILRTYFTEGLGIANIHTATNGRQCLDIIETGIPDIVFMDIMMPEMDGLEACRIIHLEHPELPVILITSTVLDSFTFDDERRYEGLRTSQSQTIERIQQSGAAGVLKGHPLELEGIEKLLSALVSN